MGSFSSSCGISALPIGEGDEVGFVMLLPNKNRSYGRVGGSSSTYTYTNDVFNPFASPVYGTYNDYGGIENIVRDETTSLLEKIFDRPIETIMECVTSNRSIYSATEDGIFETYHGKKSKFDAFKSNAEDNLLLMGFEKISDKNFKFGDFKISYTESSAHEIFTLYTFEIFDMVKDAHLATIETMQNFGSILEKFSEVTGLYPGFKKEDYSRIQLLNDMSGMFILKDVFSEMREFIDNDPYNTDDTNRLMEQWTKFLEMVNVTDLSVDDLDSEVAHKIGALIVAHSEFGHAVASSMSLPINYLPILKGHKTTDFIAIFDLYVVMITINRMFEPSFCGEQEGNIDASDHLNKISAGIIKKKKSLYGDDQ